jgi:hypothetical protein
MHSISFYLELGFRHISDLAGYDHILFLIVLCAIYQLHQWKTLLVLVTAFTVGHSITLALTSFSVISIKSEVIEFLIPMTIIATAIHNLFVRSTSEFLGYTRSYWMALFFGFIHGMGFANYFRALLMDESSILIPLLGFNLGIELGQLLFVLLVLGVAYVVTNWLKMPQRDWNIFVSGGGFSLALVLAIENRFW